MAVTFSQVITRYAMNEINDITWQDELSLSPAVFFRAKSDILINSIPNFSRPPEAQEWLAFTPPEYDEYSYRTTGSEMYGFEIETGKTGFDLCSAVLITNGLGSTVDYTHLSVEYNAETGVVTVNDNVPSDAEISIDFYKDGVFEYELSVEMQQILGKCMAFTWLGRFAENFLNMQPKISDKSFAVGSESAHITAMTARYKEMRLTLNDALLRFEQNIAYRQILPPLKQLKPLVNRTPSV